MVAHIHNPKPSLALLARKAIPYPSFTDNLGREQWGGVFAVDSTLTLRSSILYGNWAPTDPSYLGILGAILSLTNSCMAEAASYPGTGNITNAPHMLAVDSDYRLLGGSPCIDTGTNRAWMAAATDLDGEARIVNSIVDMGAYEYSDADDDGLSDSAEANLYGTYPNDPDSDEDGVSDGDEAVAGTDPLEASSYHAVGISATGTTQIVSWVSVRNRLYDVQYSTNLVEGAWDAYQTGESGSGGVIEVEVINGLPHAYYRTRVYLPDLPVITP